MVIISSFKDYYDRALGITGIDKKVIFYRKNLRETEFPKSKINFTLTPNYGVDNYRYLVISICGKRYFIINNYKSLDLKWSDFHLVTKKDLYKDEVYDKIFSSIDMRDWWKVTRFKKNKKLTKFEKAENLYPKVHGVYDEGLVEISKKLRSPIFAVYYSGSCGVKLRERSPVLKDIKGISGLFEPLQLFNDISFFIANTLTNCNPDIVQISNKDKILKAGFDLKTSFRNM